MDAIHRLKGINFCLNSVLVPLGFKLFSYLEIVRAV